MHGHHKFSMHTFFVNYALVNFSKFVKHIRGPKGFGEDAKMYWVKDGEICIVDPSESTDCYGNTGRWMWFVD